MTRSSPRPSTARGSPATSTGSTLRSPWWVDPRLDASARLPPPPRLDGPARLAHLPELQEADRRPALPPLPQPACPTPWSRSTPGTSPSSARSRSARRRYVTVLIHELEHRVGPARGFTLDPLTDEIRERYEREYHEMTYGGGQFGVGEDPDGESYRRSHFATPSIETNRRILQPLVYRVTSRKRDEGQDRRDLALVLRHCGRRLGDEHRPPPRRGPLPRPGPRAPLPGRPVANPRGRPRPPASG